MWNYEVYKGQKKQNKQKQKQKQNKKGWNTINIYNINQNKGWPAN